MAANIMRIVMVLILSGTTLNVMSPRDRGEIDGWLRGEWAVDIHDLFGGMISPSTFTCWTFSCFDY